MAFLSPAYSQQEKMRYSEMKIFDLTKSLEAHGEKKIVAKIWGMAFIAVPAPANTNGFWKK